MTKSNANKGFWQWRIVQVVVGASLILFAQEYLIQGFHEASTRQLIRWSARIAVFLFCFAFAAAPLHRLFPGPFTWWLRMNRKYIGISFAIIHLIHLVFLLILQQRFHPVFNMAKTISLLGGGLAYLFVVLMLLTSFSTFSRFLTARQWTLLHTTGGYWIWYIFIRSYVKRSLTEYEYIPIVVMLVLVILLRWWPAGKAKTVTWEAEKGEPPSTVGQI